MIEQRSALPSSDGVDTFPINHSGEPSGYTSHFSYWSRFSNTTGVGDGEGGMNTVGVACDVVVGRGTDSVEVTINVSFCSVGGVTTCWQEVSKTVRVNIAMQRCVFIKWSSPSMIKNQRLHIQQDNAFGG